MRSEGNVKIGMDEWRLVANRQTKSPDSLMKWQVLDQQHSVYTRSILDTLRAERIYHRSLWKLVVQYLTLISILFQSETDMTVLSLEREKEEA